MFVLSIIPAKQTSNVDLVLVPQEMHCATMFLCASVFHTQNTDANMQFLQENNQAGTKHS